MAKGAVSLRLDRPDGTAGEGVSSGKSAGKKSSSKKVGLRNVTDKEIPKCTACHRMITDETRALCCDRCSGEDSWKCIQCLGMAAEMYDALIAPEAQSLKWFCVQCEKELNSREVVGNRKEDDNRSDKILKLLEQLVEGSKSVEHRLNQIEVSLDNKADSSIVQQQEERINKLEKEKVFQDDNMKQIDIRIMNLEKQLLTGTEDRNLDSEKSKDMDRKTMSGVDEIQDRDRRKANLIIFNMPESEADDPEDRKLFDIAEMVDLLNELKVNTEVTRPVRLGPKRIGSRWPRPLRVTLNNEEDKWKVLKSSKNLMMSGKDIYKEIYLKRDMTQMERDHETKLRQELKSRRQQEEESGGTANWIIWRGRVVKKRD